MAPRVVTARSPSIGSRPLTITRSGSIPMRRLVLLSFAALALAPRAAAAQRTAADSAAAVADAFFRAVAAARWRDAARHVDLALFDSLRRERVGEMRAGLRTPPITPELLLQMDSTMPRAVAEWQAKKMETIAQGPTNLLPYAYARVTN